MELEDISKNLIIEFLVKNPLANYARGLIFFVNQQIYYLGSGDLVLVTLFTVLK